MGCACGGAKADVQYEVKAPDGTVTIVDSPGEARVLRASAGPATIVKVVPKTS
jgi:hypothetical protein